MLLSAHEGHHDEVPNDETAEIETVEPEEEALAQESLIHIDQDDQSQPLLTSENSNNRSGQVELEKAESSSA